MGGARAPPAPPGYATARHARFPRLRGAETEALDLRDRDFEK